jgi:hypothetical protein
VHALSQQLINGDCRLTHNDEPLLRPHAASFTWAAGACKGSVRGGSVQSDMHSPGNQINIVNATVYMSSWHHCASPDYW